MADKGKPKAAAKSGLSTQQVALILGCVAIVAAAVIVVVILLQNNETDLPDPAPNSGAGVITEENVSEILDSVRTDVERGMFMTYMNMTWTFSDGATASHDAIMGNHSDNRFPFWFTVTLNDTSEVVFTSGLLRVGTQMSEITLDTDLPAGTYPATVHINMVDDAGEAVESHMGIEVTLVIQS